MDALDYNYANSDNITLEYYLQPVADAGTGGDVCVTNYATDGYGLGATLYTTTGTGTWTKESGTGTATFSPDANSPTATVTVDAADTYTLRWTEVNGPSCTNYAEIVVNYYDQPIADAGTGGTVCEVSSFTFTGTASYGIGTWTKESGTGTAIFVDAHSATTSVSVNVPDTYTFRWTEVNATCSDYDDVSVTFEEEPVADAGVGGEACDMYNYTFTGTEASVGTGTWTQESGPGTANYGNVNSATTTVGTTLPGTYIFRWTVVNGTCDDYDEVQVIYNPLPTPAISGNATVVGGSTEVYQTAYVAGNTYSWTVTGAVSYVVNPSPNDYICEVIWGAGGAGSVEVTETITATGCEYTDILNVTIVPVALQGTITYNNSSNTPMNNLMVRLQDDAKGTIVSTTTDAVGYYKFNTVPVEVTKLEVETAKDWGGANSTDALAIQRTALNYTFPWWLPAAFVDSVGDVNESGNLSSLDALRVKQRTVHLINLFNAGNWAFWDNNSSTNFTNTGDNVATLAYTHSGATTMNIQTMCYGDVNGSFMPPSTKSMLVIESDSEIDVMESKEFKLPVKLIGEHEIGAMSIFITYPDYLIEVKDLKSEIPGLLYTIEDGWVNVAWSDIESLNIPTGGTLFTLVCSANKGVNNYMNLFMQSDETQFADANCRVLKNVHLNIDKVKVMFKSDVELSALYSLSCYPNPIKQTTNIAYSLPENGRVEISITNSLGVHITKLIDYNQDAGDYILNFDPAKYGLGTGVYNLRMVVQGETSNYTEVVRIVYMK